MTKADIVDEIAKATGIDKPAHNIPYFKPSDAFNEMMTK